MEEKEGEMEGERGKMKKGRERKEKCLLPSSNLSLMSRAHRKRKRANS